METCRHTASRSSAPASRAARSSTASPARLPSCRGFSRRALETLHPALDLSETGWGWGPDFLWPKLLDYKNVGIIDGAPFIHTRPVGQMRDLELAQRVHAASELQAGATSRSARSARTYARCS